MTRLLIVDDSEDQQDTYEMLLENEGYDITRAEDGVAGHRRAAAGELHVDVAHALNQHPDVFAGAARRERADVVVGDGRLGDVLDRALGAAQLGDQLADDRLGRHVALADSGVDGGDVGVVQVVREGQQLVAAEQPLQRQRGALRPPPG